MFQVGSICADEKTSLGTAFEGSEDGMHDSEAGDEMIVGDASAVRRGRKMCSRRRLWSIYRPSVLFLCLFGGLLRTIIFRHTELRIPGACEPL
jgi:hypothetical protein